ncbi:uncharacterized protein CDAR_522261 [Caerostris darwini]|uniref:Uncharacterized protein n=1 Tax=Caerostris darwini TaxID=1538125 RepID=A0AAV4SLL0_9ARAC|nr:uncharacterized protein CDAR_522261 [Caerostris darwini]
MEYFVDRRSPFLSPRFCLYTKIARYGQERIRSQCKCWLSIPQRSLCGAGLRQRLSLPQETGPSSPVTYTVNETRYESLLLIPVLPQHGCVYSTMALYGEQYGASFKYSVIQA